MMQTILAETCAKQLVGHKVLDHCYNSVDKVVGYWMEYDFEDEMYYPVLRFEHGCPCAYNIFMQNVTILD